MSNYSTLVFISCVAVGIYLAFDHTLARAVYKREEDLLTEGNARSIDAHRAYNAEHGINQIYVDPRTGRGYKLSDVAWA